MGNASYRQQQKIEHECQLEKEPEVLSLYFSPEQKYSRWFRSLFLLSSNKTHGRIYIKSRHAIEVDRSLHLATNFYVIHPFSCFRFYWEFFMIIFLFLSLNAVPYFILIEIALQPLTQIFLFIISLICWCDIFINFATGYFDRARKKVILEPTSIARKYILRCFISVIGSVPVDNILFLCHRGQFAIRLISALRLINIYTMLWYMERIREKKQYSFYKYRGVEILAVLIIGLHWITCAAGLSIIADMLQNAKTVDEEVTEFKYQLWLSHAVSLVFSLGDSSLTLVGWEFTIQFVAICFGMIIRNVIIVQIMLMFKSNNFSRRKYKQLIRELHEYMNFKTLPIRTRQRILNYYNFMFQNMYYNEKEIKEQISEKLLEEVEKYIFKPVFDYYVFSQCPSSLVVELIGRFQLDIYLHNDIIYREGDVSDCFYFIKCGTVAIYVHNGTQELVHLEEGSFFGATCLLGTLETRLTTIIAVEPSEVYRLHNKDFNKVILGYGECLESIKSMLNIQKQCLLDMRQTLQDDPSNLQKAKQYIEEYLNINI